MPYGYTLYRSLSLKLTYPINSDLTLRGTADLSKAYRQDYDHAYKYWRWWNSGFDTLGRRGSYPSPRTRTTAKCLLRGTCFPEHVL